jgi:hypothetical protein
MAAREGVDTGMGASEGVDTESAPIDGASDVVACVPEIDGAMLVWADEGTADGTNVV